MTEKQNAPTGTCEGNSEVIREQGHHTAAADAPVSAEQSLSELRARATGYAVLVEHPAGKYRRRLYLTLAAAERAKGRATARGQYAAVILVRLVPVTGGEFL